MAHLTTPNGTVNTPAGLVISIGGKIVYHLGDTCLFSDLKLVKERDSIDVAIVCIGGHCTMDRQDAAIAAEWVGAKTVIPCHYDTFPPIETRRPGVQGGRGVADGGKHHRRGAQQYVVVSK